MTSKEYHESKEEEHYLCACLCVEGMLKDYQLEKYSEWLPKEVISAIKSSYYRDNLLSYWDKFDKSYSL
jgi:hypothetical protein